MNSILKFFILLLAYGDPSLGFENEILKSDTKNGIIEIIHDFEEGIVKEDLLQYFPNEIEELASLVQRYFMGKHDGYSRSKVFHKDFKCIFPTKLDVT